MEGGLLRLARLCQALPCRFDARPAPHRRARSSSPSHSGPLGSAHPERPGRLQHPEPAVPQLPFGALRGRARQQRPSDLGVKGGRADPAGARVSCSSHSRMPDRRNQRTRCLGGVEGMPRRIANYPLLPGNAATGFSGGHAMDFGWWGDRDTAAAVSFLARQPGIRPGKIALLGESMGGEQASPRWVLTRGSAP